MLKFTADSQYHVHLLSVSDNWGFTLFRFGFQSCNDAAKSQEKMWPLQWAYKMIWNSVVTTFYVDCARSRMQWNSQRSNSAVTHRMMWLLTMRLSVYPLMVSSSRLKLMSAVLPLRLSSTTYLRTLIFIATDRQLRILKRCCYIFTQVNTLNGRIAAKAWRTRYIFVMSILVINFSLQPTYLGDIFVLYFV